MIIFKSISFKNFLSTGNTTNTVLLNKSPTTLIIGKNGEGKSTILDALCFSLFGKPFRNINKNQLINSINGKGTLVTVEFSVNSKEYIIKRGIKPNLFEIWCNGELINQNAATKDYQKALEQQILRLNYKTFTQVVILGSASFVPFMQLPSSQRREVIEDILDIRIFSTMNQILKEKSNATKQAIADIEASVKIAKGKVESQNTIIRTITEAKSESIKSLVDKIGANDSTITEAQESIDILSTEIETLRTKASKKSEINDQIEKAKTIRNKLSAKVETCEHHTEFFNDNHVCPSCSQDIAEEYKQKILIDLNSKLQEHVSKVDELDSILSKLNVQLTGINDLLDKLSDKNIEVSTQNSTITLLNKQNKTLQTEIETIKNDTTNADEEKRKLKELAQEAMEQIKQKTALAEQRNLEDIASQLLKDTGIKTAIIREYLPVMNKLINKYLAAMDAYIHFELDESFNEIVKSRHRDDFTYSSFSEGEKQKIDLAILFTWRQIAKMKNSVNTNLLIMDEIFDSSLDAQGTEMLMNLLGQVTVDTNVFVISHKGDQLFDKFHSVIKFEKRNDYSVIAQ